MKGTVIREFSKEVGKRKNKAIFFEISCLDCGELYSTAKNDHKRSKHPFYCSTCSKKFRRHKGTDGKPLPQTKEKKRLQSIWDKIRERTTDDKSNAWHRYGGRGIKNEFASFGEFYEWAIEIGYKDGLSIDRIDNDGNYNKENCRFVTQLEQCQNRTTGKENKYGFAGVKKRQNRFIGSLTHNGKEYYCGTFDTPEEAHQAYLNKKKEVVPE